jgi:shikimate dehydrogenase
MDRYYVIGNPIAHSRSPAIHARFAELTGQALRYERQLAPLEGFAGTLAQLIASGARGLNVTVPFKFEACSAAAQRSARATLAEAANSLNLIDGVLHADNTDGIGLVNDIQRNAGVALAGRDVLLLGAGGAAAGALAPLLSAGPRRLVVVNRTQARAASLIARHAASPDMLPLLQKTELSAPEFIRLDSNFDVIINATASSLHGAALALDANLLKPGGLAYDMMYGPAADGFLNWAKGHGGIARDGLGMLVEQAAEAFFWWRGVRPPAAQVLGELRAEMAAA